MVKHYLSKIFIVFVLVATLFSGTFAFANNNYSELYIKITDAIESIQKNDKTSAKNILTTFKEQFETLPNSDSTAGKKVLEELSKATDSLSAKKLENLSVALLNFEKEQNPVDENAEKEKFKSRVLPALDKLKIVIDSANLTEMKKEYSSFNSVWFRNEAFIRSRDIAHYGKIETALSFLRSSMEAEPLELSNVQNAYEDLKNSINSFLSGEKVSYSTDIKTLEAGIGVLEKGLDAFKNNDLKAGEKLLKSFIQAWPLFEGQIRTRDAALYTKVETQIPVIAVKGKDKSYQDDLQTIISELYKINPKAGYSFIDSALILIREGVEALLIVLALMAALKAANTRTGIKWIYAGAGVGILASCALALTLHTLFPALTSGTNREIIEGVVGIIAVIFMFSIGLWLHSKSSLQSWQNYVDTKINIAISTGSFVSMFALSFLAVFREGAETIMFYVGIIPRISTFSLILGILLALIILVVLAVIMMKITDKLPVHIMFLVLSILIYALAFKMLGVSIYILQLTNVLPMHIFDIVPTVEILGIYPTVEGLSTQLLFLLIIGGVHIKKAFKVT